MTTLEFGLYENPILIEKFIVLMLKITPFCLPPPFSHLHVVMKDKLSFLKPIKRY